jgi:hypothetical protein
VTLDPNEIPQDPDTAAAIPGPARTRVAVHGES